MSDAKPTPGPWKARKNRSRGYVVDGVGRRIARIQVGETAPDEQIAADAHLIAAAPDLLAACETGRACIQETVLGLIFGERPTDRGAVEALVNRVVDQMTAAIAKARA